MSRKYFSERTESIPLSLSGLYNKLISLYNYFSDKDYFKHLAGITNKHIPDEFKHKSSIVLDFELFPISKWSKEIVSKNNIFDVVEFFYDHVSKPFGWNDYQTETGYWYQDYERYDNRAGRKEYCSFVNKFLHRFQDGFELSFDGSILSLGSDGVQTIISSDVPKLGIENIDKKVENAIIKWRNRSLDLNEKKEAIRGMADVFEWLQKDKILKEVLNNKDESMLFNIANNFAIRHNNPNQHFNYDENIWYSWMFHFYLATFHAVSRMIQRRELS